MFPIRIKACSESDLRMLGNLARNIQRVLPVTQADIDAAAALGKGWVVWKVIEVNDPIDNLRGGTQLVIKQNSITPGQNVRRVLIVSGPGGETVVIGPGPSPLLLPDAIVNSLSYVKAFGGTEQNGTPTPNTPVDIVSNNGVLVFRDTELPTAYRRILGMTMDNDCYYEITGFKMNGSDTLRFSFTRTGANACNVLGAYDGISAQSNYSLYAGGSSSASYLRYNGNTYNSYAIADKKYDVVLTPTGSDGMQNDSTWTAKTFTSTTNLCIGTTSPSATSSKMVGSIHGSVVVDGRLELIPCERVSDGEIGYYDTYTETFFEPIGTTPTSLGYDYTKCDIVAAGPVETIEDTIGNTATAEMLLSVSNYTDEQEILSGAVTRKVRVKVLDGTENFETATATNCYSLTDTLGTGNFSDRTIYCTHFGNTPTLPGTSGRQGLAFIVNKGSEYTIAFGAKTQFSTQALWTQWLADQYAAGTPVIVIYPLTASTTESVTGQALQVTDGDNVVEITQAGMDGLELEAEYTKVA